MSSNPPSEPQVALASDMDRVGHRSETPTISEADNVPLEFKSAMVNDAEYLRLDAFSLDAIKHYKALETEIFYSFGGLTTVAPLLPDTEEALFISPYEIVLEKCIELEHEYPAEEPYTGNASTEESYSESTGGYTEQHSEESPDALIDQDIFDNSHPYFYTRNRNPREVRTQNRPPAFFNMWFKSMKMYYDSISCYPK